MNLTQQNKGYFNYDQLRKAQSLPFFVNIARGEFAPAEVLLRCLHDHILRGIALDVYDQESDLAVSLRSGQTTKNPKYSPILELAALPNVILTPHNAFNTEEAVQRKAEQSIDQIGHFLNTGTFRWSMPV